jgi:hypothetical protein
LVTLGAVDNIDAMKSGWVLRVGAAEFPHQNVMIDRGTLWMGSALCGAERALDPAGESPARPLGRDPAPRTTMIPPPPAPDEPRAVGASPAVSPTPSMAHLPVAAPPSPVAAAPAASATDSAPDQGQQAPSPLPDRGAPTVPAPKPALASSRAASASVAATTSSDAPLDAKIETFVRAIAEVARAHGPAETAAHVECLFKFGTPAPLDLDPNARAALLDGNILEADEGGDHATAWFASTSSAWQRMLRGESGDLAVCGEATLDGWTADLIARLVAKPSMAQTIRRDLRRRGIAAFGMLDS